MYDNVSYFPSFVFVVIVIFSSRNMSPAKLYMSPGLVLEDYEEKNR
jgi:hypothetical protein